MFTRDASGLQWRHLKIQSSSRLAQRYKIRCKHRIKCLKENFRLHSPKFPLSRILSYFFAPKTDVAYFFAEWFFFIYRLRVHFQTRPKFFSNYFFVSARLIRWNGLNVFTFCFQYCTGPDCVGWCRTDSHQLSTCLSKKQQFFDDFTLCIKKQ